MVCIALSFHSPAMRRGLSVRGGTVLKAVTTDAPSRLAEKFANADKKSQFIAYLTAGYPNADETVNLLLSMQAGGADVLEQGSFPDPQADGATIQKANEVALENGVGLKECLNIVKTARAQGLTVPVVLMGYYNPFFSYGLDALMDDSKDAGVDGFIVVDLPPEEGSGFVSAATKRGLTYVPLVSPTSTNERTFTCLVMQVVSCIACL